MVLVVANRLQKVQLFLVFFFFLFFVFLVSRFTGLFV
jgi:hypothetical protein